MEEHEHIEHKQETEHKPVVAKTNWASILGALSVILAIALIISVATNGFSGKSNNMPPDEAKKKVVDYVKNLVAGQSVDVQSINDNGDLYSLRLVIDGRPYDSYMTKDGSLLFPSAVELNKKIEGTGIEQMADEIEKREKPVLEMFVMSECPYGVQAEEAFFPVLNAMKGTFDFKLHFIANENGDTFSSLHGQKEIDEDIRQVCAMKYYPDKYVDYISCQNKNYLARKDISTTWNECMKTTNMDIDKVNKCSEGDEGKGLLKENIKASNEKNIGGSPTILINNRQYSGARTTQAFQKLLCNAFSKAPKECETSPTEASTEDPSHIGGCVEQ